VRPILRIALLCLQLAALAACETQTQSGAATVAESPSASATSTATPAGLSAATALAGTPLPDADRTHALIRQLIQLRGLQPAQPIPLSQETPARVTALWKQQAFPVPDSPDRSALNRAMIELGLLAPGSNLGNDMEALDSQPPLALFDPGSRSIRMAGPFEQPGMNRAFISAYDQALIANRFGDLPPVSPGAFMPLDDSRRAAVALRAGDAALLDEQWTRLFGSLGAGAPTDLPGTFAATAATPLPADFASQDLAFRQQAGLAFIRQLYLKGGWAAVDKAHQVAPFSSEMILHPERFPRDLPAALPMPDLAAALPPGWRSLPAGSLGEWGTVLVLKSRLPDDVAQAAAAGWGNDHLLIFAGPQAEEIAMVWLASWDTIRDSQEFITAMRIFGDDRFEERHPSTGDAYFWPGGPAWLERSSDQTLWIMAPSQAIGSALRQALTFPLRQP
jgi:hypothetical protein